MTRIGQRGQTYPLLPSILRPAFVALASQVGRHAGVETAYSLQTVFHLLPAARPHTRCNPLVRLQVPGHGRVDGSHYRGVYCGFKSVLFFCTSTDYGVKESFVWALEVKYSWDSALRRDRLA